MPTLPVLDTANRWTATAWPSETACEQLSAASSMTAVKNISDFSQDEEGTLEELIPKVLHLLIQDGEQATVIIRDAIRAEQNWQRILSERMNDEHVVLSQLQERNSFTQKTIDMIPTISLVAGGISTMVASAGVAGASFGMGVGAVALGALLALDTFLPDHRMKKAVASFLGMDTTTDSKAWLQKICVVTNLLVMGLYPLVTNGTGALVAQSTASLVGDTAQANTQYALNQQMARMTESQRFWGTSKDRLDDLFGDANSQMETISGLYDMLTEFQRSITQTTDQIFRS